VDVSELGAQLARTHWGWVVIAIAAGLGGLFARAMRWRYLFAPDARPPALVPAMMIGYMANNVLPLRAGEFVRVYVVSRNWAHGFWAALATLIMERVLDSLSLVLILGVLVLLIPVPALFRNAALVVLAIDVVGVAILAWLVIYPDAGRRMLRRLGRRWPALDARLSRMYHRFVLGLDGIRTASNVIPLLVWTVIVWVLPAFAAWATLRAVDLHLPRARHQHPVGPGLHRRLPRRRREGGRDLRPLLVRGRRLRDRVPRQSVRAGDPRGVALSPARGTVPRRSHARAASAAGRSAAAGVTAPRLPCGVRKPSCRVRRPC
jgi:uncharacterized membrane protein YbhN (UPF0104 family)